MTVDKCNKESGYPLQKNLANTGNSFSVHIEIVYGCILLLDKILKIIRWKKLCCNSYGTPIFGKTLTSSEHQLLKYTISFLLHIEQRCMKWGSDLDKFCLFACLLWPDRSISLGHITSTNSSSEGFLAAEIQETAPKNHIQKRLDKALISFAAVDGQ